MSSPSAAPTAPTGGDQQNQEMRQNMGIVPRGPSPGFSAMRAGQIQRGDQPMIGTQDRPTLQPGEVNPATGLTSQMAHDRNQAFRPNPSSIQMTEQIARPIWHNILQQHTQGGNTDYGKASQDFHNYMQTNHGVDGNALLNQWKQNGTLLQTQFAQPGQMTPAVPGMPMSMIGTDKSGGTPAPGMIPMQRGQSVGGSPAMPMMGPQPGSTPLATNEAPFFQPQQHTLSAPSPSMPMSTSPSATPSFTNPADLPQAGENSVDVRNRQDARGMRQQALDQQGELSKAIVQAPIVKQQVANEGKLNAVQAQQEGANTRSAGTNASRERISKTTAEARVQAAQQRALSARQPGAPSAGLNDNQFLTQWGTEFKNSERIGVPDDKNPGKNRPLTLGEREAWVNGVMSKWDPKQQAQTTQPQAGAAPAAQPQGQPEIPEGATLNQDGTLAYKGGKYVRDEVNKGWKKAG